MRTPSRPSSHLIPAVMLLAGALATSGCESTSVQPTTEGTHDRITSVLEEAPIATPTSTPTPPETSKEALIKAREKVACDLVAELLSKTTSKYGSGGSQKTHLTSIVTPTGQRLAVSLQLKGELVNIYAGDKRYYTESGPGILQISLAHFASEIESYTRITRPNYRPAENDTASLPHQRALLFDNYIDFHYAGDGYAYGEDNLAEVFSAFGFDPKTPTQEKLETVLKTLLEQL